MPPVLPQLVSCSSYLSYDLSRYEMAALIGRRLAGSQHTPAGRLTAHAGWQAPSMRPPGRQSAGSGPDGAGFCQTNLIEIKYLRILMRMTAADSARIGKNLDGNNGFFQNLNLSCLRFAKVFLRTGSARTLGSLARTSAS